MTNRGAATGWRKEGRRRRSPGSAALSLKVASVLVLLVVLGGTTGYTLVEGWSLLDSLFMTVLTLSTVGYGEVHPLSPQGKVLSIFIIATGVGTVAYILGTATRIMLDERIRLLMGRKAMKTIRMMKDHYIICGYGRMGRVICQELKEVGTDFLVVENDPEVLDEMERHGFSGIRGDATDDEVLLEAGIERALGLVSVVSNDTENVFIVLTARGLNPRLNIVARAAGEESVRKLQRAGASKVVSPYYLGGFRIAQAVTSPTVLGFLESIVHDKAMELRLEEVPVSTSSRLDGLTLASSGLRQELDLIILAIKESTGGMLFNPSSGQEIRAGDTLVVLGRRPSLDELRKIALG